MLKQEEVDAEEESLRKAARELSEEQRAEFYRQAGKVVKDPDTYAALNWFLSPGCIIFIWGAGDGG